jgi:hypothetical protein
MAWTAGFPTDRMDERQRAAFLREVYTRVKADTFTWNPPNVPATSAVDTTLTTTDAPELTGLRAGMPVAVTPPSTVDTGITWGAWVGADDTLTIRLRNHTGSDVDMASGTWGYMGVLP